MIDLLVWAVVGAIAGWLASVIMKTDGSQGLVMDIILGIIGGTVGGFLLGVLGLPGVTGLNLYSFGVSVLGAVALIWLGKILFRSSRTSSV